ncbi:SRPBCC family protein [Oceaniovalibus sp. ACAM 378]|uniref:SRPBCC family protein n=1 Tax=Oceaniovalibus sp. ACAM 378 TaxID=2599923 RepID=UPI0011D4655D|nr:SRPBCC family protein [Oceaniovalibus sp. ACAM 378]TYB86106.1 SRPBCC family protein [Oceaniovalibus sp. ACAM 378]
MTEQDDVDRFAKMTDNSTLVIQRWLPGPADRVWRYLTDSDLRRKWLAAGGMDLVPGAPLELVWRNDTLSDADDTRPSGFAEEQRMQSSIVAVDPPRMLTIAWGKGDVTFMLKEKGNRVLLTVTHRGLDDRNMRRMTAPGWHMHLDILSAELSGVEPASFWSGWSELQALYDDRLPK